MQKSNELSGAQVRDKSMLITLAKCPNEWLRSNALSSYRRDIRMQIRDLRVTVRLMRRMQGTPAAQLLRDEVEYAAADLRRYWRQYDHIRATRR